MMFFTVNPGYGPSPDNDNAGVSGRIGNGRDCACPP